MTGWHAGDRAIPVGDHIGMGGGRLGGFSAWIVVAADVCVRVPESVPTRHAVLGEPMGNGLHFVRRGRLQPGQRVAIFGAGQIGLSILYWARRLGAGRIVVSEPAPQRAQLEGTRNYLGIAALGQSLRLIEDVGIERIEARVGELTDYVVREAERRGCRIESPRSASEWSGIVLFRPPAGGPSAGDLVARMHAQRITINAREGCIHMGVHFYNTRAEIDAVIDSLTQ